MKSTLVINLHNKVNIHNAYIDYQPNTQVLKMVSNAFTSTYILSTIDIHLVVVT